MTQNVFWLQKLSTLLSHLFQRLPESCSPTAEQISVKLICKKVSIRIKNKKAERKRKRKAKKPKEK